MSCSRTDALLLGLSKATHTAVRLTLFPGEALRLPRTCRAVSVWVGEAWISQAGRDIRLTPGGTMTVSGKDAAVVSVLGDFTLILELRK
jgi:hypothetical protein